VYLPKHFREDRIDVLHGAIRRIRLGILVTHGREGLVATHMPLLLEEGPGPFGTLRGHLSRANPQWREFSPDTPALAIFSGPQHYISPSWYPSKAEHGRVVPTWNYVAVHAYGRMQKFEDPEALLRNVRGLTIENEADLTPSWAVEDAPPEFIAGQLSGIVGVEIPIDRLEGKWKVSQNRSEADRAGAAESLACLGTLGAAQMSDLIRKAK
jgi:transcriptional regulator